MGTGANPKYEGAGKYEPLPFLAFDYENRFIQIRSLGLGVEADSMPALMFRAVRLAQYDDCQDGEVDHAAFASLPEVRSN